MGGRAFKDESGNILTTKIKKQEVKPTLDNLLSNVLRHAGIDFYVTLGSTGKKPISGDVDIAVGPIQMDDPKALKATKSNILRKIQNVVGSDKAKLVGANIAIMHEISGRKNEFVQVDVMLSEDPKKTEWLMSGTSEGVKGMYRNLLLSYLARIRSEESLGTKITISYPGGIQVVKDGKVSAPKTESPNAIMSILGIPGSPSDISTFEGLVSILVNDPGVSEKLSGFENYISRYLVDPNTHDEAQKAIEAIKMTKGLNETLRRIIRILI